MLAVAQLLARRQQFYVASNVQRKSLHEPELRVRSVVLRAEHVDGVQPVFHQRRPHVDR